MYPCSRCQGLGRHPGPTQPNNEGVSPEGRAVSACPGGHRCPLTVFVRPCRPSQLSSSLEGRPLVGERAQRAGEVRGVGSEGARHAQQPASGDWAGPLPRLPHPPRTPCLHGPCLFPCPRHPPGGPRGQGQGWPLGHLGLRVLGPGSVPGIGQGRELDVGLGALVGQVDACQEHWFSGCLGCRRLGQSC